MSETERESARANVCVCVCVYVCVCVCVCVCVLHEYRKEAFDFGNIAGDLSMELQKVLA